MIAGMAEVIAAHKFGADGFCACQLWNVFEAETTFHAIHVAQELAKAGHGDVADAWDEGATAGWKQSGEGFNSEYPDESTGGCSVDLSGNPYREPQHG